MIIVYSPQYHIDIGPHVFPTLKYRLVADALIEQQLVPPGGFASPEPASWTDLTLVHTDDYLSKVRELRLSAAEVRELEIPCSEGVVKGFRLMTGGTLAAARHAWSDGTAVHIGGGFHHAFANHGEGFCLFNDVAMAIRVLQRDAGARRFAIVDCDVHHGNGTAMIFDGDPDVFTFSIHQQHNYPMFKPRSRLDIGLADGTGDKEYLRRLGEAMPVVFAERPDVVFYLAGADPFREDQLGGLSLSHDGLRQRDRLVVEATRAAGARLVVTLAGGYARRVEDTVAAHVATIEEAMFTPHDQRGAREGRGDG